MARILVVGTGSIGKRHIGNLLKLGAQVSAYRYRSACTAGAEPLPEGITQVGDLAQALSGPLDAVVVANRTDLHMPVALAAARQAKGLFIEKPVSHTLAGVTELFELSRRHNLVVESGFMLRFHPNLRWIKDFLAEGMLGEIYYARASVGQYLPDWRPGTDHRRSYSARRAWGGGVIFDLAHELDLVGWLLGEVAEVAAFTGYSAAMEIETEAIAQVGLRTRSGVLAQVHLDYLRPGYARTLDIVGRHGSLAWDYLGGTVVLERAGARPEIAHRVPEGFERNDMFRAHMRHFLARLDGRESTAAASLEDGVAMLRVALACHRSAEARQFARPEEIGLEYRATEAAA